MHPAEDRARAPLRMNMLYPPKAVDQALGWSKTNS